MFILRFYIIINVKRPNKLKSKLRLFLKSKISKYVFRSFCFKMFVKFGLNFVYSNSIHVKVSKLLVSIDNIAIGVIGRAR